MPIIKLPADIMICIFSDLRDMHLHLNSHRWLFVTHVCQYWRLLALDFPELWTQIYSLNPDCVQAFLLRSKEMPLYVNYPWSLDKDVDCIKSVLFSASHRFRRLELVLLGAANAFLMHSFPRGAPLLSHLKLSYPSEIPENAPVCQNGFPTLRHLELERFSTGNFATTRSLLNSSLRSLVITQPHPRRSPSLWTRILAQLPLLEELTFTCALPRLDWNDLSQTEPVSIPPICLPHLSSLNLLGDNPVDQLSLLQCIIPSNDIRIKFVSYVHDKLYRKIPLERYIAIMDTLNQRFMPDTRTKTRICPTYLNLRTSMDSTTNTFGDLYVRLSTTSDYSNFYCSRSITDMESLNLVLLLHLQGLKLAPNDLQPIYDMLCNTFSLSNLRIFSLEPKFTQDIATLGILRSLLTQMTSLRVLSIDSTHLSNHLSTLLGVMSVATKAENEVNGDGAPSPVLFPTLEVLTIHILDQFWETDFEPLRLVLLAREAAGYPISRIHLCPRGRDVPHIAEKIKSIITPQAPWGPCMDYCVKIDEKYHVVDVKETILSDSINISR